MRVLTRFFKVHGILLFSFFLALFLRVYDLPNLPTGLHGDETSIGYNAYSLLKTARDQNGNFLPVAIDQFGDFRPAGYHYLAIPFVAVLGLNELAVRLPAAIFGALTVIALYLFINEFFKDRRVALTGAFLLAITPWHINLSRATSESVIAAFFIILGVHLVLRSLKQRNIYSLSLSLSLGFFSFFISFLFYHAARFFVPALLVVLIPILFASFKIEKIQKVRILSLSFVLIFFLGLLLLLGQGANRPLDISLLNIPGGDKLIYQQIGEDGIQNPYITRFFHNKFHFYSRLFLESLSQHLSLDFLFVNTGLPIRYRIPWTGNLHFIFAPFLVFGLASLLFQGIKSRKILYLIPLTWLLLGAFPAALTYEDVPNVQRASLMIPALIIITTFGFYEMLDLLQSRYARFTLLVVCAIFLFQNFLYFSHNYFHHGKFDEPWHRSAAIKELMFTIEDLSRGDKKIVMTTQGNNNLIHYLFYQKFDPYTFQKLGSPREKNGLEFQNVVYTYSTCPIEGNPLENALVEKDVIYIGQAECSKRLPKNAEIIKTIRHPDGIPAYIVVKLNEVPIL